MAKGKKMIYIVVAAVALVMAILGWKMTTRTGYESAAYTVLESDGDIEVRLYPDLMLATTSMANGVEGGDGSFGRLFQYISGANEEKQKVAMTTPVFMEPTRKTKDERIGPLGRMGFVLPKDVADDKIPQPANSQVQVAQRPGGKFAVIRFAGRLNSQSRDRHQKLLEQWMEEHELIAEGPAEIASYDPPWTPGIFRRNEILIRIGT